MRIDDRRLFPYPVLTARRDDYKTCKFTAELKPSFEAADNLILDVDFSTDCAEIKNLIAEGDAEYLLHVECPATIERLYLVAFIVLRRDVKNFSCKDWNEDFDWLSFE